MPLPRRSALLAFAVLALAPRVSLAQAVRLAPDAEVKSIRYRFHGPHVLQPEDLNAALTLTAPGPLEGIQGAVSWIPFIPDRPHHPLDPLTLQTDVVRLRRLYRRQGFLEAKIDYLTRVDRERRKVDLTFDIEEGEPLLLHSLTISDARGREGLGLSDSLRDEMGRAWERVQRRAIGTRFQEQQVESFRLKILNWFANRGFPFTKTEPRAVIDSVGHRADLDWVTDPGPRVRLAGIEIEGLHSVAPKHVTRQMPLSPGDWAQRDQLEKGRANLQSVALFRRTNVAIDGTATADTSLPLRVSINETRARLTNVELGYVTDGAGVTGQVRWTHPNFTGGARSLDAIGLVQTGWGTTSDIPDKLLRGSLTLNQPYVFSPLVSFGVGPAAELRDGRVDKSTSYSGIGTLVYRFNPLQSAALRYDFTYRHLIQLKIAGIEANGLFNPTLLAFGSQALIDSLTEPARISQFIFFTSLGHLDDISRPRHGLIVKPNLAVTFPRVLGNVEFARADLQATMFRPIIGKSNALMLRGTLGGVWPFGDSDPRPGGSAAFQWLRLRDEVLTAGGANDVRGYDSELLGPKFPDVEASISNGDTTYSSDHYIAIGGLRRFTASAEFRIGLPMISRDVFMHLFGDMGRVWTTDTRFQLNQIRADDETYHYTTGGGLGYYTPVGAIRVDLGYKLNPSVYDLRNPDDVVRLALQGRPVIEAPVDHWRRFVLHVALGLYF